MTIYDLNNNAFYEAVVTKDAIIKYALMGDYYINLSFQAAEYINFKRGYYILYGGKKFEIMTTIRPERLSSGGYRYEVRFDAQQEHMKRRCLFWLDGSVPEATFHDTTTLDAYGRLIADNMNAFLGGEDWSFGDAPSNLDGVTKTITFDGSTCWDAINAIAEAFEVEWWIEEDLRARIIYFGKLEKGETEPFVIGDTVKEIPSKRGEDADYGTRFYVFGSDRNLPKDYSDTAQGGVTNHVSQVRLHLPEGYSYIDAKTDLAPADVVERVVIFDDVYPKNTDTITAIETIKREIIEGEENDAYVMKAEDTPFIPSDVMSGETLMCEFTSGALMGRQFELALIDDNNENIDPAAWQEGNVFNKRFEIIAQTEDAGNTAIIVPNEYLHPNVGDTFVLIGVELPTERIAEAEQELLEKGQEHAAKNSSDTDVYECPTNPVYCHKNDKNFVLGQRVVLYDPRFENGQRESRIQGLEKKLWNEYEATYTVGDNTTYSRLGAIQNGIDETKHEIVKVKDNVDRQFATTKRDMKDMQQTTSMLVESLLANFGDAVSPIVVKTMMTLIGDESLQFRFVNSRVQPQTVTHNFSFDPELKVFYSDAGIIQHMTLGIKTISSSHLNSSYMFWDMAAFESEHLEVAETSYYLYAKVSKTEDTGEFILSEEPITMEQEDGYYHLLTGILNSENNKERSFVPMYGYTEILPGRITTDLLTSPDNGLIIDLVNGHITGDVTFGKNSSGLENIPEYKELTDRMDEVEETTATEYVIWFVEQGATEDYIPSLENYPAVDWTTDEMKADHEWDIFYNRYSGQAWRFLSGDWEEITDADTIAALTQATEAKKRVDDLEFLRDALDPYEEQTTEISNGLILTGFVGIKDATQKIVAALLNGLNGLPYLAAGIGDVENIGTSSKLTVDQDGKIEQRDTSSPTDTQRRLRMSVGEITFSLGDGAPEVTLVPDKVTANTEDEMAFSSLANDDTGDVVVSLPSTAHILGSIKDQQTISSVQIGRSCSVIAVDSGSIVNNSYLYTYQVTPRLVTEEGEVLVSGSTVILSHITEGQLGTIATLDALNYTDTQGKSFNKVVRYELSVVGVETGTLPPSTIIPTTSLTATYNGNLTVYNNTYRSAYDNRFFGNGLFFAKSAEQYFGALVDDSNGVVVEARNGDQGFRMYSEGFKKWHKDFGWIPSDGVIFRGIVTISDNSFSGTPSISNSYSAFGTTATVAINTSKNRFVVTLPSDIGLTTTNRVLTLVGMNAGADTTPIYASITEATANTFTIFTGGDGSPKSGNFYFEVKAI